MNNGRITLTHKITVLIAILALLALPLSAMAAVWTDQQDYAPGSTVTIHGDNSDDAAYQAGETVHVSVTGPSSYTATCDATVSTDPTANGAWLCQVTLASDDTAVGTYEYTATGLSSGASQNGTFTDAINTDTSINLPSSVTYGNSFTFSGAVTRHSGSGSVTSGTVEVQQDASSSHDCTSPAFGPNSVIASLSISTGPYNSGAFSPVRISPFGTPLAAGNYYVTASPSVGEYGFRAQYSDASTPPTFGNSNTTCQKLTVNKADTSASANASSGSIAQGASTTVDYTVSSTNGVTGNTATGTVAVVKDSGPGNLNCAATSTAVSAAQTTGNGFTFAVNGSTNTANRFTCTPDATGSYTFHVAFTDSDGNYNGSNSSDLSLTVTPSDSTPPVITPNVSCNNSGNAPWCKGTITVSWTVVDSESAITSSSGCGTTTISTDTGAAGTTLACQATSAGGTDSQSVTVYRDGTPPTISASISPANPASTGWYNIATGAPTVSFTCNDTGGSGLASACPASVTLGNGAGQSVSGGPISDVAGNNSGVATISNINVDLIAPTISASISPADPASTGWYNIATGAPTVSFTCSDATSGLAAACPTAYTFPEGKDQNYSQTISDNAGNSSSAGVEHVNVDLTAPSISAALDRSPDTVTGWFNIATGAPTVQFTCSDSGSSGLASCPANHLFGEGADQSYSGTAFDTAGNSASAGVEHVNVDLTAPSVTIVTPANGASYLLNQPVTASYSCSDSGSSGIASCAGPVANGANIDTASVGSKSFTVNASDVAGNTNSATNNYTVAFKLCVLYDQTKSHKSGSTVPLKLQLCDVNGVNYSSSSIVVTAISVSKSDNSAPGVLDDSGSANSPDMNFRFDATLGTTGGYIFNLSTKGLTTGTWKVTFTVDGVSAPTYFVQFDIK